MHREQSGYNTIDLEDEPFKIGGANVIICSAHHYQWALSTRIRAEEKLQQLLKEGPKPQLEGAVDLEHWAYVKCLKWLLGKDDLQ